MKKLIALFLLTGCGATNLSVANFTGYANKCIDGVEYLQFPSGVTVKYDRDGKIKNCQ